MKVLLHIGQSKTGTSAIQAFLTLNRDRLARAGIIYPSVRVGGTNVDLGAHNAIADAITGRIIYPFLSAEDYSSQLFGGAKYSNARQMIISGEHFFGGEPRIWDVPDERSYFEGYRNKVRGVARFLQGYQTDILLYLRPQADWLGSAASQTIRIQGLLSKKDAYRNDRQFYEMMKPLLRYGQLLDIWQEEMPRARISAVPYVRGQLVNGDSIADFLHRAGLDATELSLGRTQFNVNDSISREFIEVKKALNRGLHSSVRELAIIVCLQRLSRGSRFSSNYTFPADITAEIVAQAEAENAIVNAKYAWEGTSLAPTGADGKAVAEPSAADYEAATAAFEAEFSKARYRIMEMDFSMRSFLRRNARPVHGILHQLKRLYRNVRYHQTRPNKRGL